MRAIIYRTLMIVSFPIFFALVLMEGLRVAWPVNWKKFKWAFENTPTDDELKNMP